MMKRFLAVRHSEAGSCGTTADNPARRGYLAGAFALAALIAGCTSVPTDIPPDLTQRELFQLAQEELDLENWEGALVYYRTVKERFPDDPEASASADYNIAFLDYKRGDYAEAQEGFIALIERYESADEATARALPQWPLVLSRRVLTTVEERLAEESENG